jgi:cytosine/adenosine deaminase-related metal-dependent hydrolase
MYTFDKNYGEQALNEALTLFDDFNNRDNERIKIRFGPQGADFLDLDLLKRVKELARERHTTIHMHLAQGAREHADIICVDLNTPSMAPVYTTPMRNMVPNLVYSARGNEVATVIVDGRILMEEHVPVTFNVQEVVSNAQHHADIIGEKAAPLFNEIHGMNAIYMEEDKL